MKKIMYYAKQLLPLTYVSSYAVGNKKEICVWKMFLGKCYNIRSYEVVG